MSEYIFIFAFLDGCGHCVNFKNNSLGEVKNKLDQLGIEHEEVFFTSGMAKERNPNFYKLKGMWFPSFYLIKKNSWYGNGTLEGYMMGGEISDGSIKKTGGISMEPNKIIEWTKSKIGDNYLSYESRLNKLIY